MFLLRIFLLVKPDDLVALKLRKTAAIEGKLLIVFFLRGEHPKQSRRASVHTSNAMCCPINLGFTLVASITSKV
ncbi:hypothetical protein BLOT_015519 [Blomia tropicalis]|nr:hypothetical protein BLOT_015519 [Blomia tropicalis]